MDSIISKSMKTNFENAKFKNRFDICLGYQGTYNAKPTDKKLKQIQWLSIFQMGQEQNH